MYNAKKIRNLITCVTVAALTFSTATAAAAAEQTDEPTLEELEQLSNSRISEATNVLDGVAQVVSTAEEKNVINEVVSGTKITVPQNPAEGIILETVETGKYFSIDLPFSTVAEDAFVLDKGIVAYDNLNDSTTIPVVKEDGSVQITTVIDSDAAPTRYEYALDVPLGATVSLADSGEVIITDSNGDFIGGATKAWAYDSEGNAVRTRYELEGSTLTQIVEHDKSFSYPIVADPWWGINLLEWANVSNHGSYYRVNAQATGWGRTFNGLPTHASHVSELKAKLGANAWRVDTNGGTIREQFLCHVAGNYFEWGTYNMESNRPAVWWPSQLNLSDQCNPN